MGPPRPAVPLVTPPPRPARLVTPPPRPVHVVIIRLRSVCTGYMAMGILRCHLHHSVIRLTYPCEQRFTNAGGNCGLEVAECEAQNGRRWATVHIGHHSRPGVQALGAGRRASRLAVRSSAGQDRDPERRSGRRRARRPVCRQPSIARSRLALPSSIRVAHGITDVNARPARVSGHRIFTRQL